MKPLAVLLSIIAGSAVALAVALGMTGVVFLLLPEYSARLAPEQAPLLRGLAWSWSLAAIAAASLYAELKNRRWRLQAHALLVAILVALAWRFWPA